ncbi:hypothetical protein AX16_010129 [Volvariella volvacea WC 439]|nr:hypothetical protein AX16_010129 [Volvariella volvacea WC 439]
MTTHEISHDENDSTRATTPTTEEPIKPNPLPKFQLFIVLLIQFSEPITATVIYPFIAQFIHETGITNGDEKRTGYFAGVIESIFFLAEALTVVSWGRASDYFGRRPILLLGPFGLSVAMLSFGWSKHFWALVVSRCFQGVFNGNIGVSKSVMAELSDSTNMADAFSMIPLMWSVGSTLGPIIGGIFARPAQRWPDTLGRIELFKEYPYLLPCAISSFLALISGIIASLSLKETLPSAIKRHRRRAEKRKSDSSAISPLLGNSPERSDSYGSIPGSDASSATLEANPAEIENEDAETLPPPLRDLLTRPAIIALSNYGFLAFSEMSLQVLMPLVWSTSIPLGGLGFTPYQIGTTLGIWGIANAVFQMNFLGKLMRKYGPTKLYIISYAGMLIGLSSYSLENWLARRAGRVDGWVWGAIAVHLMASSLAYMAYASIQIHIVDSAPSKSALGSMNGLAQSIGCVVRSTAPSFASSLFSISLEKHLLGGRLVYAVLLGVFLMGIRASLMLPKQLRMNSKSM